jgi:hypothetical protein
MKPTSMEEAKAGFVAQFDLPAGAEKIKASPMAHMVRGLILKELRGFPHIHPAEREDLAQALFEVAIRGGQRDASSLDGVMRALKPYEDRLDPSGGTHGNLVSLVTIIYRKGWSALASAMDIMMEDFLEGQTWTERQVAAGAEPIDVLRTEMVEPGNIAAGMRVKTVPMKAPH